MDCRSCRAWGLHYNLVRIFWTAPTRVGGYTLQALTSLGVDANGETYLVDEDVLGGTGIGSVYKIVRGQ